MIIPDKPSLIIKKLFQARDELSFRNIRSGLFPVLLVFPLSVISGNLRYFEHSIALTGFATNEMMFFFLGLGWFILAFTPKQHIIIFLRLSAFIAVLISVILVFIPISIWQSTFYMTFKFFMGLSAACAFYLFCFVLNNVERLAGMIISVCL